MYFKIENMGKILKNKSLVLKIGIGCFLILAVILDSLIKDISLFKLFTPSFLLSWLIIYLIDNYLWRLSWTKHFFGSIPNLNGQWIAEVRKIGDLKDHSMHVEIKQKWSSIHFEFIGDRVKSNSTITELSKIGDNYHIKYMWSGNFIDNDISPPNLEGAAALDFILNDETLMGRYWTFHPTNSTLGKMVFKRK